MNRVGDKMKPEVKTLWVESLRDGSYKKGRGALHRSNSDGDFFCCLGVLVDLALLNGVELVKGFNTRTCSISYSDSKYNETWAELPRTVRLWAGLEEGSSNPLVVDEGKVTSLSVLNDRVYDEFGPIADIIEAQL